MGHPVSALFGQRDPTQLADYLTKAYLHVPCSVASEDYETETGLYQSQSYSITLGVVVLSRLFRFARESIAIYPE
jgi:hypothetical protein